MEFLTDENLAEFKVLAAAPGANRIRQERLELAAGSHSALAQSLDLNHIGRLTGVIPDAGERDDSKGKVVGPHTTIAWVNCVDCV